MYPVTDAPSAGRSKWCMSNPRNNKGFMAHQQTRPYQASILAAMQSHTGLYHPTRASSEEETCNWFLRGQFGLGLGYSPKLEALSMA